MNVLVIGANGQIGQQLVANIAKKTKHAPFAMIRDEKQRGHIEALGAEIIIGDLLEDFSFAYNNMDAVIFTAGSGGKGGPELTKKIDQEAAIKAATIAQEKGIQRFILVSTIHSGESDKVPEALAYYMEAKGIADQAVLASDLAYTIVRPGTLTDDGATNKFATFTNEGNNAITRADVASFLTAILFKENTYRKILTIRNGELSLSDYLLNM